MKTNKKMLTAILMLMIFAGGGCTDEFKYTIPPKYPPVDPEGPVVYDVTFAGLLDELASYEEMAKFPAQDYKLLQASSYDRASVNPGTPEWFSNADGLGYIRKEKNGGRNEVVMMEHEGPGAITRIWLTSLTDKNAVVRFYFNGNTMPDWTVDFYNMQDFDNELQVQGGAKPLSAGFVQPLSAWNRGSNLYLPIPYTGGCKITYEEQSTVANATRYFQINYRAYAAGTKVETFSSKVFNSSRSKVAAANSQLIDPKGKVSGRLLTAEETLGQSELVKLDLTPGSNAVTELKVEVSGSGANYADVMDKLIFMSQFDGTVTAGLSLSDLCAAGPGSPAVSNYFVSADGNGSITLRYVMPYAQTGALGVRNNSEHSVKVKVTARVGSFARDSRTLYFHAAAKNELDVRLIQCFDYARCYDWDFATIQGGRGVLRGDMFSMNNHTYDWPGESDEKIYVDNETFPSHFGTGVEDYYGFCRELKYQYPMVGQPRLDGDDWKFHDILTYYRVRALDAIPFNSKLRFTFEMSAMQEGTCDMRNSVIWYGDPDTKAAGMKEYTFE